MAKWIQLVNFLVYITQVSTIEQFRSFVSETELNHLAINTNNDTVYIGAVNRLYQFSRELRLLINVTTGPRLDHKKCTPPIDSNQCPMASPTDNYNKLLLLDVPGERIVVCGSIFKGICSLRRLSNISDQLSYDDSRGEKSFVASNDEKFETVGLVTDMNIGGPRVLFVGKGTSQHDNGIIISTRILDEKEDKVPFETFQDSATFKSGFSSVSTQQFVTVFEDSERIYFISSLLDKNSGRNRTFITRLCKMDSNYFSYVEMDLVCKDGNTYYNICISAYLERAGEELANAMGISEVNNKVLFAVFSTFDNNQEKTAVCTFSLESINKKFEDNRERCYNSTSEPINQAGENIFSKPFGEKIGCGGQKSQIENQSMKYPCGSEHLPSPLQSKDGVVSEAVLLRENNPYTSVAVSVENEHTIAFLGTAEGKLVKAFLGEQSREYRVLSFDTKSTVKNGMAFDGDKSHLYVMTKKKVHRVPVQDCARYSDCNECTQAKDPYCGWCVINGTCTLKKDCARAHEPNHWLWSPDGVCLKIESVQPSNMSVKHLGNVMLSVAPPIALLHNDKLRCVFGGNNQSAILESDGSISCPHPYSIPASLIGHDYVNVTIQLFVANGVFIAGSTYQFYNCEESMNLSENLPCISCVTTRWECGWNINNHKCVDTSPSNDANLISQEENCPQVYQLEPSFIPMERKSTIQFDGKNLETFKDGRFTAGNAGKLKFTATVLRMENTENQFSLSIPELPAQDEETVALDIYVKVNSQKIDSKLNVSLYNCFFGRSDCSLCRAANPKYKCVWCNNRCVYEDKCKAPEAKAEECPDPLITDFTPKAAPLSGGILLTIMGSNLGITSQDVQEIKVAGVDCIFKPENYSVSTRVICEVGPAPFTQSGSINILVNGKEGFSPSNLAFTYQEPEPTSVRPVEGVLAGGTYITISGQNLETGSKNDVQVSLHGAPCKVISFGEEIICITSKGNKEEAVKVKLSYGTNTLKEAGKFTYRKNPVISQFNPDRSFASGGRNVTISGSGFNRVQNFSMMATLQSSREKRELDGNAFHVIEKEDILEKVNDTVIIFSSPQVPENYLNSEVTVVIKMDGFMTNLQTTELSFNYLADPSFDNFTDGIKKQVNNLINAKGSKLNDAMTIEEAKAFVGEGICKINTLTSTDLYCVPPEEQPPPRRRHKRDTTDNLPEFTVRFGNREWILGKVEYGLSPAIPLHIIIPVVLIPMILIIVTAVYFYRRKSRQAEREYEKVRLQLEGLEESVRDRCKKEFTDLMIEMEDQTNDLNETGIPFLDYKMYTDRVFFWPSKDGEKDVMITGKLDIPEGRRQTVEVALNQFSNLLNSKSFLTIFIHTLENQKDFSAREKLYFASLLTVALHGKLEYYTDIMRTLFVELMEQYVAKNPKLMLRRSETVVERMLSNWMSICLYQYLKDTAGEHLYKLFKAIKHQVEKGPVDAVQIKAKYTLNDTGLLGDDVEYTQLTVNVIVQDEGLEPVPVKVLNCDTIEQVKEKIIEQVYKSLPYSHRPKADSLALEWRPGSTAQILSDLDLTSLKDGRWKRMNTLMHYNVRDNATLILSRIGISQQQEENHQDLPGERHALLEDENKVWHLVRPVDEVDESKSKRGSLKPKEQTKAITEIYLTRLLSVKGTLQQFVDNFFQSVLNSKPVVPPAVKYFFDFLDEQAEKYEIKDEDTVHIWKTNSLSLRFWVNILKNPHFIFDVHVHQVVDASLSVIAQTFMDACSRTEHKLSRESPSNKLLYAKEISTYKKMVEDYYKGIRQMVQVSDQDMNTHLAEISRAHTESLNSMVALHQLYQYTKKYYDEIINALEEDPSAQRMQLAIRLQQIAAALENKVTDL